MMPARIQLIPLARETIKTHGNLPYDKNLILRQLSAADRLELGRDAELVAFAVHDVMYEVDDRFDTVWFPISGMISVTTDLKDGGAVEVGASGKEGVIGFEGLLGAKKSTRNQFCQIKGEAITVSLASVKKIFTSGSGLKPMLCFLHAHFFEASQGVACNRVHSAEERLARWLLVTRDRIASNELPLTHEFLSMMLGARRSTVSLAAGKFQAAGLIHYTRGKIEITDAAGLRNASCECYEMIKEQQVV